MSRKTPSPGDNRTGGTAFDLLDEAYFLLRDNLLNILPLHLLASIPFLLALMYFIFRFENFQSSDDDIISWSLLLTGLFCWKNFFHCLLSAKMTDIVSNRPVAKPDAKKAAMILMKQTFIHALGPLFIILLIESPWTFGAFVLVAVFMFPALLYTGDVVCAVEPELGLNVFIKKILFHISKNFIRQLLMMLIVIIGTAILTFNIAITVMVIPFMLKSFWGIETQFTIAGGMSFSLFFNTTIWSIIIAFSWLIIDPFCRMLYVLRVFYGESISKGWDIQAALQKIRKSAGKSVLILLLLSSLSIVEAKAAENTVETNTEKNRATAEQLEKNIGQTLKKLEFQWRKPVKEKLSQEDSWISHYISKAVEYCAEKIGDFLKYLKDLFGSDKSTDNSNPSSWRAFLVNTWQILRYVIPVLLIAAILYIAYRKFRNRKLNAMRELKSSARRPDLNREDVAADELEEEEWLKLSNELLNKKEFRLALRALYLACIRALAQRKLLLVARYKTDYEYLRELRRRAHTLPGTISAFENSVCVFQRVWYGDYPVSRELVNSYMADSKILLSADKAETPKLPGVNPDET